MCVCLFVSVAGCPECTPCLGALDNSLCMHVPCHPLVATDNSPDRKARSKGRSVPDRGPKRLTPQPCVLCYICCRNAKRYSAISTFMREVTVTGQPAATTGH